MNKMNNVSRMGATFFCKVRIEFTKNKARSTFHYENHSIVIVRDHLNFFIVIHLFLFLSNYYLIVNDFNNNNFLFILIKIIKYIFLFIWLEFLSSLLYLPKILKK